MDVSSLLKDKCGKEISNCTNEEIYYNLNIINEAMEKNKKITFNYSDNQVDTSKINPTYMINDNDYYYLVGRKDNIDDIFYYRIDKMTDIKILEEYAETGGSNGTEH